jgi:hypothetical protein
VFVLMMNTGERRITETSMLAFEPSKLPPRLAERVCERMAEHLPKDRYAIQECAVEISMIGGRRAFAVRIVAMMPGQPLARFEVQTFVVAGDRYDVIFAILTPVALAEATRPTIDAIIASIEIGESI